MSNSTVQDVGVVAMVVVVVVVVVVDAVVDVVVTVDQRAKRKELFLISYFLLHYITWLSAAIPIPAIATPAVVSATFQ